MTASGQLPLPKLRAQVVATSRALHRMGWVANHDGNVSVRLTGGRLLATPTALSKLDVDDASLIVVDGKGTVVEGRRKAFGELDLHLASYAARSDVMAVVHAHPPYATAMGLVGKGLEAFAMPEVVVSLGPKVPLAARAMPKSKESTARLAELLDEHDAVMLAGNGVVTVGVDLEQAYLRMELVEHVARIHSIAAQLGRIEPLSQAEVDTLVAARTKAGLGPAARKAAKK